MIQRNDAGVSSYLIAFTVRSGSNHLCDCLTENGFGYPTEYFHYPHGTANQPWYDFLGVPIHDLPGYLRALLSMRTQNGVFGAKVTWDHRNALLGELRRRGLVIADLDAIFPGLRWIYLERRDKIGQAISLARAIQTGRWTSEEEAEPLPFVYDYFRLLSHFQTLLSESYAWEQFFSTLDRPVLRIIYEDFVARPRETVIEVRRFLDPSLDPIGVEAVRIPARFKRQHDPRSDEMRRRFLEDLNHIGDDRHWDDRASQVRNWNAFFGESEWNRP